MTADYFGRLYTKKCRKLKTDAFNAIQMKLMSNWNHIQYRSNLSAVGLFVIKRYSNSMELNRLYLRYYPPGLNQLNK